MHIMQIFDETGDKLVELSYTTERTTIFVAKQWHARACANNLNYVFRVFSNDKLVWES